VVSGFLGSGKTTLVQQLLREAQQTGLRVAVISNEFGELGIDQALLGDGDEAFVELDGGCVCCKLSDELLETLEMLHERVDPDAVVIETSGVALPGEVQLNFWREPVSEWVADDVAVIVVNAEQVLEGRELSATFEAQVSSADLLLLNQIDRVPVEELARLEEQLREIEPDAPLFRTVHCGIDPNLLFPPDPNGLRTARRRAAPAPAAHSHEEFEAQELRFQDGATPEEIVIRLRELGALRAKGFVRTSEGLRLVQGVGARLDLTETGAAPAEDLIGRVVVIRR
jgi:G3E family GTPase